MWAGVAGGAGGREPVDQQEQRSPYLQLPARQPRKAALPDLKLAADEHPAQLQPHQPDHSAQPQAHSHLQKGTRLPLPRRISVNAFIQQLRRADKSKLHDVTGIWRIAVIV